jgi:hypothetical protein
MRRIRKRRYCFTVAFTNHFIGVRGLIRSFLLAKIGKGLKSPGNEITIPHAGCFCQPKEPLLELLHEAVLLDEELRKDKM